MLANAAAMNYGFAFRIATYIALRKIPTDVFGGPSPAAFVVDSPHNSIYEEPLVGGESAVVHRHNSCRAYPAELMPAGTVFGKTGLALLLPGPIDVARTWRVAGRIRAQPALRLPWRRHGGHLLRSPRAVRPGPESRTRPCGSATPTPRPPARRIWMTRAWTPCSRC